MQEFISLFKQKYSTHTNTYLDINIESHAYIYIHKYEGTHTKRHVYKH